jgi:hypothetical protein
MNQPAISLLLSVLVSDEHRPYLPLSLIFLGSTLTCFKQTHVLSFTYPFVLTSFSLVSFVTGSPHHHCLVTHHPSLELRSDTDKRHLFRFRLPANRLGRSTTCTTIGKPDRTYS